MLDVADLEKRVANLTHQAEEALSQYHVILGSKMTMEGLLTEVKKAAEAVAIVDPGVAPEAEKVEAALDAIGQI